MLTPVPTAILARTGLRWVAVPMSIAEPSAALRAGTVAGKSHGSSLGDTASVLDRPPLLLLPSMPPAAIFTRPQPTGKWY